jgi:hypothetical protein
MRKLTSNLLELGIKLEATSLDVVSGLDGSLLSLGKSLNRHRNGLGRRGGSLGGGGNSLRLLRLTRRLLGDRSGGSHNRGRGRNGGRLVRLGLLRSLLGRLLGHFMIYTNTFFLSVLTHYILYP